MTPGAVPDGSGAKPLVICGGPIHTADQGGSIAEAVALQNGRILSIGRTTDVLAAAGPNHQKFELNGQSVIPGLIDGHAHLDREGLKSVWPSLAGVRSIDDLLDRIRDLVAAAAPGEWIVTMPIGLPPDYGGMPALLAEERWPNRWDLDRVAPNNPVYIRPIWGYWRNTPPLVSIANSCALRICNVTRETRPPADGITLERDGSGELTGVFFEQTMMPVVELTLLRNAPHFSLPQRISALAKSMRAYNAVGTTAVFEGHGVAPQVIAAYQGLAGTSAQTVRATLVFSAPWSTSTAPISEMLSSWCRWLAGHGLGDNWLTVHGLFAEEGKEPSQEPRAAALPQTGWAGFCYNSALPRHSLRELLLEAARNKIRVATIWPQVAELFQEVHSQIPIDAQRWVWGHIGILDHAQIEIIRDLGLVVTTHTNRHIAKSGLAHLERLGPSQAHKIVPLRSLIDNGIPVSFGSDNLPPSLFHVLHDVVTRRVGNVEIAPDQRISRQEALRCATWGGAYLSLREAEFGSLEPGKCADLVILPRDLMGVNEPDIAMLSPDFTLVGGRPVYARNPAPLR